jgi:hypothetical protein
VQDLDFEHLHKTSGSEAYFQSMTATSPTAKRKREGTFEDKFTDVEIDDTQLDEEDLKQLDCIESPQKISPEKLPNGNLKCNHTCKDKTKYRPGVQMIFNIYRCRHLCCKDGKIDKKGKAKVSTSKGRKSSRPSQLERTPDDNRETQVLKESNLPIPSSIGINLHVSPLEKINPAETLKPQMVENPYSISGFGHLNTGKSASGVPSTFETASTPTIDTSQPSRRHCDMIASRGSSHLGSTGTNSFQRLTTWNLNDGISDSDDLPLPENLLSKIMPTTGARSYPKVMSVQDSANNVQKMVDAAARDETDVQQRRVKRSDILLGGVAFSIDDIMECVEIV